MTQKQRPGCCLGGAGGGGGGGSGNQSEEGVPSCVLLPLASWPLLPPPRRALTLPHASPQPDPTSCSPSPQSPPLHLDAPHPLPVNTSQVFPDPGFSLTIPPTLPVLAYPPRIFSGLAPTHEAAGPIPTGPVRLGAWALARNSPPNTSPPKNASIRVCVYLQVFTNRRLVRHSLIMDHGT